MQNKAQQRKRGDTATEEGGTTGRGGDYGRSKKNLTVYKLFQVQSTQNPPNHPDLINVVREYVW